MAVTKFTAIYVNNEGKIIEREIPGMNTYKIAEKFAIMLNDPEERINATDWNLVSAMVYALKEADEFEKKQKRTEKKQPKKVEE